MNRCPYCLHPHAGRGRACSEWCEQKIRGLKSSVTGGRTRAIRKILTADLTRCRHRTWWREVAMGRNEGHYVQRIFELDLPAPFVRR